MIRGLASIFIYAFLVSLCHSQDDNQKEVGSFQSVSILPSQSINGEEVSLEIELVLGSDVPSGGKVVLELPKQTQHYEGRGIENSTDSMIVSTFYDRKYSYNEVVEKRLRNNEVQEVLQKKLTQLEKDKELQTSPGSRNEYLNFYESYHEDSLLLERKFLEGKIFRGEATDKVEFYLSEMVEHQAGGKVIINAWGFVNPPSLRPFTNLKVYTTDAEDNILDIKENISFETIYGNYFTYGSTAQIDKNRYKGEKNAVYAFKLVTMNPIPIDGYLTIQLPDSVELDFHNSHFECVNGCNKKNTSVYYLEDERTLVLEGIFTEYVERFARVEFKIHGFTNPDNYKNNFFTVSSFEETYLIDYYTFNIVPEGVITFYEVSPTFLAKWTFLSTYWHFIISADKDMSKEMTFVLSLEGGFSGSMWYSDCKVTGLSGYVYCYTQDESTLSIYYYADEDYQAGTVLDFFVNKIENTQREGDIMVDIYSYFQDGDFYYSFDHQAEGTYHYQGNNNKDPGQFLQ